jgi:hypothetical protein
MASLSERDASARRRCYTGPGWHADTDATGLSDDRLVKTNDNLRLIKVKGAIFFGTSEKNHEFMRV